MVINFYETATRAIGRIFFLDVNASRILSANADGTDRKVILNGCRIPEHIVSDVTCLGTDVIGRSNNN
jgi:hypothetical protein